MFETRRWLLGSVLLSVVALGTGTFMVGRATADDEDEHAPAWLCVVNATDHHKIAVLLGDNEVGKVDPLAGSVYKLEANKKYHFQVHDHKGKETLEEHIKARKGEVIVKEIDH